MQNTKESLTGLVQHIDIGIGERVRTRRKALHMSQSHLAEAIGMTFQQVQKYERGINRISASTLFMIARALKVPVWWFFEGLAPADDEASPASMMDPQTFSAEAPDLMSAYLSIPGQAVRRRIVELMNTLAKDS